MSYGDEYRISIEPLANGFAVEVPDMEAREKKMAEAKKNMKGRDSYPTPYLGDCTKKFAAKSTKEVLALVKASLEKLPDSEYDTAFEEKAAAKD